MKLEIIMERRKSFQMKISDPNFSFFTFKTSAKLYQKFDLRVPKNNLNLHPLTIRIDCNLPHLTIYVMFNEEGLHFSEILILILKKKKKPKVQST